MRQGGRARGGDNVIDLNAWRAANLEAWADGEAYAAAEGAEAEEPELSVPLGAEVIGTASYIPWKPAWTPQIGQKKGADPARPPWLWL